MADNAGDVESESNEGKYTIALLSSELPLLELEVYIFSSSESSE